MSNSRKRQTYRFIRSVFLVFLLVGFFPFHCHGETLTILHTNDTHSHIMPFDLPEFGKNIGGVARRAEYIKLVKSVASQVMVLDGGDVFQGTPFYSFFKGEADFQAFSSCGYDATTLGNHDLDDGMENLSRQLKIASFPLLCSNVTYSETGKLAFPPFALFDRGNLHIAVIGVIGPAAYEVITLKNRQNLTMTDPVKTVQSYVDQVRDKADLIVLLSHSGYEFDLEMAMKIDGLDVIIGGHTNTFVEKPMLVKRSPTLVKSPTKNKIGGTLVLQAFKWGVYVGRLDLNFDEEKELVGYSGHLELMDEKIPIPAESPVLRLVNAYQARIQQMTSQVIGTAKEPLKYSEDKHKFDLPLGTFACEALREFGGADMAIVNSGTIRDGLPAGEITLGHIYTAFPFDNTLVVVRMTGKGIQDMLDFISSHYGKITGYQYSGVTFTINLPLKKATDIFIQDQPLDPAKEYKVSTISYLTDGNQNGNDLFRGMLSKQDNGFFIRDVIVEYVRQHGVVKPPPAGQIRVQP